MTPDVLAHLFEPFFTTKAVGKGTGMGLPSVYGTVKSHNGAIVVDSSPDKGTEFTLYFPRAVTRATTTSMKDPLGSAKAPGLKILLAEDEPDVRELVLDVLRANGHTVFVAEDGGQAIELYMQEREQLDLVILDMQMPKVSGSEAIAAIRRADPKVKIIVSSGYNSEALTMEVNGYLQKPFRQREMLKLIESVISEEQAGA
jgi:CheY-like chemotaxis protein